METASQLLEQAIKVMRAHQLSSRTETAYSDWIFRYFLFNNKRAPQEMGEPEVAKFLNYLSDEGKKSASTQNQAHCALLFLYNDVLHQPLTKIHFSRLKNYRFVPEILTKAEIEVLFSFMEGVPKLVAALLYGCGLKIMEGLTLRIRDIDMERKQLVLKNRVLSFPASLEPGLHAQIREVRAIHQEDVRSGFGEADIPAAIRLKNPDEAKTLGWQYLFPASRRSAHLSSGKEIRFHMHESVLQKAMKHALEQANLNKNACCHSLRHSFATHLLESGQDIATVQSLLGHRNKRSTMIYTYLVKQNAKVKANQPVNLFY